MTFLTSRFADIIIFLDSDLQPLLEGYKEKYQLIKLSCLCVSKLISTWAKRSAAGKNFGVHGSAKPQGTRRKT
jgi:hypothetical protein